MREHTYVAGNAMPDGCNPWSSECLLGMFVYAELCLYLEYVVTAAEFTGFIVCRNLVFNLLSLF
jgi:hypothetical protein